MASSGRVHNWMVTYPGNRTFRVPITSNIKSDSSLRLVKNHFTNNNFLAPIPKVINIENSRSKIGLVTESGDPSQYQT